MNVLSKFLRFNQLFLMDLVMCTISKNKTKFLFGLHGSCTLSRRFESAEKHLYKRTLWIVILHTASTNAPQASISRIVDLTMGYYVSAEEEPNGINRTVEVNLVDKLEIIIENTVVCIVRVVNRSDYPTPL